MRVIAQTVPGSPYISHLMEEIPQLEVAVDTTRIAFRTFLASLEMQGPDGALHVEDDIILTSNFLAKVEAELARFVLWPGKVAREVQLCGSVVQFFSMRSDDAVSGSRWDRKFAMNQCTWIPPGHAPKLVEFGWAWHKVHPQHPGGYDLMMDEWLRGRKEPHWISVPSLVQHRIGRSRISPRSSRRQSQSFVP